MKQLKLLQEYAGRRAGSVICADEPEAALLIERGAAVDITPKPGDEAQEAPKPRKPKK